MGKINIGANTSIPMPVTLVGSIVEGKPNFMAAAWVTRVNATPPYLAIGIHKRQYTSSGIREIRSFSINLPSADMVIETDYCGFVSGRKTDKSSIFELFYGEIKTAPMIQKCPLCIECRVVDIYEMPTNNLFIGEIVAAYTEEKYLTNGELDIKKMNLMILTMPDNNYWAIGEHVGDAWNIGKRLLQEKPA
jgi:flavin reductase (DIM6/NTAB) family NADH-FMN oxidoreductase RutF